MYVVELVTKDKDGVQQAICNDEKELQALIINYDKDKYWIGNMYVIKGFSYKEFIKKEKDLETGA